ncbi:MAG: hypothetical protein H0X50_01040 [Nitrosopumilus sp.]|nr:hypothetical protein [Nitrosopumilus sp.]
MDERSQSANNEKVILLEDCSEDKLKSGILTLTNKKIVFEKTKGRIVTLSKKLIDEKLEIEFNDISGIKSEGLIIKKLVVALKNNNIYKFGVLSPGKWVKEIRIQSGTHNNRHE